MSDASAKQNRSSPSSTNAWGVQPKTFTPSWRDSLLGSAWSSRRGGAQNATSGKPPGSSSPSARPAARRGRAGRPRSAYLRFGRSRKRRSSPFTLKSSTRTRRRMPGWASSRRISASAVLVLVATPLMPGDRDVAALGAVEEVEVDVDRLAVAPQPDGQRALHRVLVEREPALLAPRPPHRQPRVGRHPALRVDAHHLHLGRPHQLAGHLALGDHHRVGGHAWRPRGRRATRSTMPYVTTSPTGSGVVTATRSSTSSDSPSRIPTWNAWLLAAWWPSTTPTPLTPPPPRRSGSATPTAATGSASSRAPAAARRTARSARRRSPIRWRSRHSRRRDRGQVLRRARVAVGAPGEVGQLARRRGRRAGPPRRPRASAATSPRRIPAQPPVAGARQALVPGEPVLADREERRALADAEARRRTPPRRGRRYMRWWLLMAPTTGPSASRRNDSRPSSTTRRSGGDSSSASVELELPGAARPPAAPGRSPRGPPPRAAPSGTRPSGGRSRGRSPTVSTCAAHRDALDPRRARPAATSTAPAAIANAAPGSADGLAGGRDREPRLDLLGAVDERPARRAPRPADRCGRHVTPSTAGVDRGGLGVRRGRVPVRTRDPRPGPEALGSGASIRRL